MHKVNSLVIIGSFILIYNENLPRPTAKEKSVVKQTHFHAPMKRRL